MSAVQCLSIGNAFGNCILARLGVSAMSHEQWCHEQWRDGAFALSALMYFIFLFRIQHMRHDTEGIWHNIYGIRHMALGQKAIG
jgi:hypothetical protein